MDAMRNLFVVYAICAVSVFLRFAAPVVGSTFTWSILLLPQFNLSSASSSAWPLGQTIPSAATCQVLCVMKVLQIC